MWLAMLCLYFVISLQQFHIYHWVCHCHIRHVYFTLDRQDIRKFCTVVTVLGSVEVYFRDIVILYFTNCQNRIETVKSESSSPSYADIMIQLRLGQKYCSS